MGKRFHPNNRIVLAIHSEAIRREYNTFLYNTRPQASIRHHVYRRGPPTGPWSLLLYIPRKIGLNLFGTMRLILVTQTSTTKRAQIPGRTHPSTHPSATHLCGIAAHTLEAVTGGCGYHTFFPTRFSPTSTLLLRGIRRPGYLVYVFNRSGTQNTIFLGLFFGVTVE